MRKSFRHPIYDDTNVHIEASELACHAPRIFGTRQQGVFRFIFFAATWPTLSPRGKRYACLCFCLAFTLLRH